MHEPETHSFAKNAIPSFERHILQYQWLYGVAVVVMVLLAIFT